ncbi:MAG: 2-C-methyl-D-erythritol 4-phosphate cytidylyltransferase [Candidatus Rokubacteria bacterium]|nr:2-C-methyl-D-erythritol 4-phosphate cytidylyltransferase [Candidatus Rokubacteria bacterium]
MRSVASVIPAGGVGRRLGRATPKQFLAIGGVPILVRTVRCFTRHPRVGLVVVAAPAALVGRTARLLGRYLPAVRVSSLDGSPAAGPALGARGRNVGGSVAGARGAVASSRHGASVPVPVLVVPGGAERQDSVVRGLEAVPASFDLVLVHDAVRPFVSGALIDRVIDAARETGAAICALPIAETVKRVRDGAVDTTVDRTGLWVVQTPQGFRTAVLREAHDKARRDGVVGTDDAMLVERLGHPVRVVLGLVENIKITTPADLGRARRWTAR